MKPLQIFINESILVKPGQTSFALINLKSSLESLAGNKSNAKNYLYGLGYAMDDIMFISNKNKKGKYSKELISAYVTFVYEAFNATKYWPSVEIDDEDNETWSIQVPDKYERDELLNMIKDNLDNPNALSISSGALFYGVWPESFAADIQDSDASGKVLDMKNEMLKIYQNFCRDLEIDSLM